MKEIICTGIILLLAGRGLAISGGQPADSIAEGGTVRKKQTSSVRRTGINVDLNV